MKRRITVEQLNELTEEQKLKLRDWWRSDAFRLYDLAYDEKLAVNCNGVINVCNQEMIELSIDAIPLLDIGQMIELLHSKVNVSFFDRDPGPVWSVMKDKTWYDKPELCDALWEAVKAVL